MTASASSKRQETKKHDVLGATQEGETKPSNAAEGQVEQVLARDGAKNPDFIEVVSQEK